MRHLLQHAQVQLSALDKRRRLADVDTLDPIARDGVEHIDVGVGVDEELPVAHGDGGGDGRVHDLAVPGLATLHVHVDSESVEDQQEFTVRELDGPQGIHGRIGQEAEHLVVGVDKSCAERGKQIK